LLLGSPREPPSEFGDALGEAGIARFARDGLGPAGVSHVIVRIGVNDLGFPGAFLPGARPVTAESLIDGYRKLIAQARRARVRIIGTTITPFEGATTAAGFYTPAKELARQKINAWLRTERDFKGLIDLDRVLRDPDHPTRLLPAYDSGDHLHPNDEGYAASANAVALSLFGIT
jgi:lysophospholipase L1-like esterase